MKLEDQVCSLELSKRLKELGVKQESLFWWVHSSWNPAEGEPWEIGYKEDFPGAGTQKEDYSAFTVAELGEMLPKGFTSGFRGQAEGFRVCCRSKTIRAVYDKVEADARAKMLIYLIEKNLIDFNGLITNYGEKP